jgi:TetR/AcrR family transcriptional regulator, regulator of mycofactocin system
MPAAQAPVATGRRRITSRAELEHVAFDLFDRQGFEETTVDDIAAAARIGRRTFFRYFPSKNDIPWGDFDGELDRMRAQLKTFPAGLPLMDALRAAIVDFNRITRDQVPQHRRRMRLILWVPALKAHSTLRFTAWRQVIAEFAAERLAVPAGTLAPQAIAHAVLGVAVAAYEQWLETEDGDLSDLLDAAMRHLTAAFTASATAPLTSPA